MKLILAPLIAAIFASTLVVGNDDYTKFLLGAGLKKSNMKSELVQGGKDYDLKCYEIRGRAECSSQYTQTYINGISRCGMQAQEEINATEYSCRTNGKGDYCKEFLSQDLVYNVTFGCFDSYIGCSKRCRTAVTTAYNLMGCCAGFYFRKEMDTCGIPPPSACRRSSLKIPSFPQDGDCITAAQYQDRRFTFFCYFKDVVVNALKDDEVGCYGMGNSIKTKCSKTGGQYCLRKLGAFSNNFPNERKSLEDATYGCDEASTNCSAQCRSALTEVKSDLGCCLYAVNVTGNEYFSYDSTIMSKDLWKMCGVDLPPRCTSSESDDKVLLDDVKSRKIQYI